MSTFAKTQAFTIPPVPRENIAQSDGSLHPTWNNYFVQLTGALSNVVSTEGITAPSLTAAQLPVVNNANATAKFIYNSSTGLMMVNNAGTYANIQTF
jgi:hypothetical protein